MDYIQYNIQTNSEVSEILMAFLGELPFDTFQETDKGFDAFIKKSDHSNEIESEIKNLKNKFNFSFTIEQIGSKNWNEVWESNFQPVLIEGFCGIRADFHPRFKNVQHEIIINPRMAFGTGHHATTYMMMELMQNMDLSNKAILDYGCGTGILAILAKKMGCEDVEGVDIEEPAYLNSIENADRNNALGIQFYHGILENVPQRKFDIILANINRNVILDTLPALNKRLNPGGILFTSGFLQQDKEIMFKAQLENGFLPVKHKNIDKWMAAKSFRRYD